MRLHSATLGVYVPGMGDFIDADDSAFLTSLAPNLGPSLGDFVAADREAFLTDLSPHLGDFIGADRSAFLTSLAANLGDTVPTAPLYPIPQNSVLTAYGLAGLAAHDDCGCGCAGTGGCGGGLSGISDMMSSVTTWAEGQFAKIKAGDMATIAIWAGGGLLAAYFLFGFRFGGYSSARKEAAADYRAKLAKLRAEYPTTAGRARRAASAF